MMWVWILVVAIAVVALGVLVWWTSGRAKPAGDRPTGMTGTYGVFGRTPGKQ